MFGFLKTIIALALLLGVALVIIYFLPTEIKMKGLSAFQNALPASAQEKIEGFTLTPSEQRGTLLTKLDETLQELKMDSSPEKIQSFVTDSENIITKLKTLNESQSITESLTANLTHTLLSNLTCPK